MQNQDFWCHEYSLILRAYLATNIGLHPCLIVLTEICSIFYWKWLTTASLLTACFSRNVMKEMKTQYLLVLCWHSTKELFLQKYVLFKCIWCQIPISNLYLHQCCRTSFKSTSISRYVDKYCIWNDGKVIHNLAKVKKALL